MATKKPNHLKLIDGNPGKRAIKKPAAAQGAPLDPKPPAWLDKKAHRHWKRAVKECAPGTLLAVDAPLLAMWAETVVRVEDLNAELRKCSNLTYTTASGTEHVNPLVPALRSQTDLVTKLARQLGFTPASRGNVTPAPVSKPVNPFDSFAT